MSTVTAFDRTEKPRKIEVHTCCIHEIFEQQARRTPASTAISFQEQHLTFAELNERANRAASYLRRLGVGPEVPVMLYLDRSLEMVVSILAVLKAGGAYVPIDLAYPKERVLFMMQDTQAPLLITQEKFRSTLAETGARVLCLDTEWEHIAEESPRDVQTTVHPDNLAYIIYTSGSTGKPKGVMVTHHNVVRLLTQTHGWYGFSSDDVWPLFHSYAFDVSVWELWGSLFNGGRLIIVPYLVTRSPAEFYELLAREKVTVLNQTPSAFRQLIWAEMTAPKRHPLHLRYVICAGEALELQSLKPWFEIHGDDSPKIVNMYGITETTVHSTFRIIRKVDVEQGLGSVVGVPIPDLQIHLLDEELRAVPPGCPGEICVGGAGVARGYLKRPELTAQRFIPDVFSNQPGGKLYRSGDLAQYTKDGELEYLGRMDHQVKIRGFRVELGEIESALNRHTGVRESVVLASGASGAEMRLIAYYVPVQGALTVSELREFLARVLPEYMMPAVFMPLPALPLTTNGKVDRRALPVPDGTRPEMKTEFVAPGNHVEEIIAGIWDEVLGVQQVGLNDNFFELGGDSIRSITILSRINERIGWKLKLQDLFQCPTVAGLENRGQSAATDVDAPSTEPFSLVSMEDREKMAADVEDAYPITTLQLGMFFRNELHPESAMYHDVFSYQVKAVLDAEKLRKCVNSLGQRHPILRTSFHLAGYSVPMQLVHRAVTVPLTYEEVSACSPDEQEQKIIEWIEIEKRCPFDRTRPALVRFHAQAQSTNQFQLFISFHHSCIDGWSLAAAVTEVLQNYAALLKNGSIDLSAPKPVYRDFVALEQKSIASEDGKTFWRNKIAGAVSGQLPRYPKRFCAGGLEQKRGPEVHIDPMVLDGLRSVAQESGVPLKTVLLAAHQAVMGYLLGQSDVTTGLITNGRPEVTDGEKMIGLFLNATPLRMQLRDGTWFDLVKETFSAEQELLPYRRFPMAEVQKLNCGRPLFETAFDFVHFHLFRELARHVDFKESHYFEANDLAAYTTFMLDAASNRLELHIDYDPNIISRHQIERMTEYYLAALRAISVSPEERYDSFNPLSDEERQQIIFGWNTTQEDYPRTQRIEQLFERCALQNPAKLAVIFGEETLTYHELNVRASGLAERLASAGAGPGVLVAIFMERSLHMVLSLLAILKSGAAYVPLDPAFPTERLELMLNDSGAPLVLTQIQLLDSLPKTNAAVILVDEEGSAIPKVPHTGRAESQKRCSDLAYVIYTSGSTGTPKGVQVTHQSVVNLLSSAARVTSFSPGDNLLAVTTLSFDIAGLEIFMPLTAGGQVTIAPREILADGFALGELITSSGATFMQGTPSTWRLLIESGWKGHKALKVLCGGEALKEKLATDLLLRVREVWNFYGPTETTIWSTAWKVEPGTPVVIGRPLANTQAYILGAQKLSPRPIGGIGELYLAGDGVARGYLNRPGLTEERFGVNPFVPGSRMYQTGDLARYTPEGKIECLGRVDHQVKIRGYRIELGEIETVLRQHTGIADALVAAREDKVGEKRLVGYVVSRNGPPASDELRAFMGRRLPLYMVPSHFVLVQEFPLTPNGKVDLQRLPSPEEGVLTPRKYVAPRCPEEQWVSQIWQEVLMQPQIGVESNFFELGGDSLSATRVFARINKLFHMDLSLRDLFENPTIAAVASIIRERRGRPAPELEQIPRLPRL